MATDSGTDYREVARMAYSNGEELYNEAKSLQTKGSPRAFTLAVASIEELIKAELADMVGKGSAKSSDLVAEINGKWKPLLTAKREGGEAKALEVDRVLRETLDTSSVKVQGKAHIEELILKMETRRQDSLYVGVKGKKGGIKHPRNQITPEMSQELIEILEDLLKSVETNLMVSKERYTRAARELYEERRGQARAASSG